MIRDIGWPPIGVENPPIELIEGEPRRVVSVSFLKELYFGKGKNGKLAQYESQQGSLEMIIQIREFFEMHLLEIDNTEIIGRFQSNFRDPCRCFEIIPVEREALARIAFEYQQPIVRKPSDRKTRGLPPLELLRQISEVSQWNLFVAAEIGAERYLTFAPAEQKLAGFYGLRTDFDPDEEFPDVF